MNRNLIYILMGRVQEVAFEEPNTMPPPASSILGQIMKGVKWRNVDANLGRSPSSFECNKTHLFGIGESR